VFGSAISTSAFDRDARWVGPVVLLAFAILAFWDYSGSIVVAPSVALGGDSTMILTRALAGLNPDLYRLDYLFSDAGNYTFYNNANVVLFQIAAALGSDRPDTVLRVLKGLTSFAFLLGWYLLGARLSGSWLAGVALALACTLTTPTVVGDYWGLYREAQPRVLFGACLPYIVLLAIDARRLGHWVATFVVSGFAFWLHPASGPPVALATMTAMVVGNHDRHKLPQLACYSLVSGLVYLAIIAPNFGQYVIDVLRASHGGDPALTAEAMRLRFAEEYVDVLHGIDAGLKSIFAGPRSMLALLGIAGAWLVWRKGAGDEQRRLRVVLIMLVAILALSCLVPVVENVAARAAGRQPLQLDLVRAVRYVVPLLLLLAVWGLSCIKRHWMQRLLPLGVLVFWATASFWPPRLAQNSAPYWGARCWVELDLQCRAPAMDPAGEMIAFVASQTPREALFFSSWFGPSIRALAQRPLAFDWKDTGWLAYSNHAKLGGSLPAMRRYLTIAQDGSLADPALQWVMMGHDLEADYVVVREAVDPETLAGWGEVVFQNMVGSVIELTADRQGHREDAAAS
jgi:hypothetical protein